MIETLDFYKYLKSKQIDMFTGVPDSLLANICACITDNSDKTHNIIAANEGNAIAIAAGYYLATRKYGLVYMQNSGLGNTVNPLLSLADEDVYQIPMLLLIGWRGEPNIHDEPQHVKQGKVTLSLLDTMGIKYIILDDDYESKIDECIDYMRTTSKPIALIVRKNAFSSYKLKSSISKNVYTMSREEMLNTVLQTLSSDDLVVSTTGKTSREIFELRELHKTGHANDFLTVGSMGHTASLALGVSLGTEKNVYCIDGDGSFIMHMGGFSVLTSVMKKNFKYILNNNGAHESVGGQPTVAFDINTEDILRSSGFKHVLRATNEEELKRALKDMTRLESVALVVYTKQGSRDNLGRPTTTPIDNKLAFMGKVEEI